MCWTRAASRCACSSSPSLLLGTAVLWLRHGMRARGCLCAFSSAPAAATAHAATAATAVAPGCCQVVKVVLGDGSGSASYQAAVVGTDAMHDLAVLKVRLCSMHACRHAACLHGCFEAAVRLMIHSPRPMLLRADRRPFRAAAGAHPHGHIRRPQGDTAAGRLRAPTVVRPYPGCEQPCVQPAWLPTCATTLQITCRSASRFTRLATPAA